MSIAMPQAPVSRLAATSMPASEARRPKRASLPRVSVADYLAAERVALHKHEYIRGVVREMPGGTYEHGLIAANVIIALGIALNEADYTILTGDVKVYIDHDVFYYPDVSVVQGSPQIDFEEAIRDPFIVVEALSTSTELFDRAEKFENYRKVPALRHYLLISQERPFVEHYAKGDDGVWSLVGEHNGLDTGVALSDIGVTLPLSRIYRHVSFPELQTNESKADAE